MDRSHDRKTLAEAMRLAPDTLQSNGRTHGIERVHASPRSLRPEKHERFDVHSANHAEVHRVKLSRELRSVNQIPAHTNDLFVDDVVQHSSGSGTQGIRDQYWTGWAPPRTAVGHTQMWRLTEMKKI